MNGRRTRFIPGISELIQELNSIGYHGIIRTNGTLPIPKVENFRRMRHGIKPISLATPPKYYDEMFITKNPDDCWQDKAKYCADNNIPYQCVPYKRYGDPSFVAEPLQEDGKQRLSSNIGLQLVHMATWDIVLHIGTVKRIIIYLIWHLHCCGIWVNARVVKVYLEY